MTVAKVTNVNPFAACRTCGASSIHAPQVFRSVVERERSRSDRNGHRFSIAVFTVGRDPCRDRAAGRLVTLLASRVRCTDEVGWVRKSHVGVMLPETRPQGAWRFAQAIATTMTTDGCTLRTQVYTYPSAAALEDEKGDAGQLWLSGIDGTEGELSDGTKSVSSDLSAFDRYVADPGTCSAGSPDDVETLLHPCVPAWKRIVDVAAALTALVVLSPLFAVIAAIIKLESRGPVFFRQVRVGLRGQPFHCLKFRSMYVTADQAAHKQHMAGLIRADLPMTKLDDESDVRVTPIGRFLRATELDELPQLVNVLRGEMSLIGPRPGIPYEYHDLERWQRRRVDSLPGLTGLWQVSGKNRTTFKEMVRLDIAYGRSHSFWLDTRIVVKTMPVILRQAWASFRHPERGDKAALLERFRGALRAARQAITDQLRNQSENAKGMRA